MKGKKINNSFSGTEADTTAVTLQPYGYTKDEAFSM